MLIISQTLSKFQTPMSNGFGSDFGHLVIRDYLGFGYWNFPKTAGFDSAYAGLGNRDA